MKKVILSIALAASGLFVLTSVQAANTVNEEIITEISFDDDGFVDIKFENLNEKVQTAVRGVAENYDLNALKYNAEKRLTKVEATNKQDQSRKTFYFDDEGKEVVMEEAVKEEAVKEEAVKENAVEETETMMQEETPSVEGFYTVTNDDDGFVEVKLEDLNEKVQASINALKETFEIGKISYNAEKQIAKVEVTSKEDQSQKKIYFDNEGMETTCDKPVENVEKDTKNEEVL